MRAASDSRSLQHLLVSFRKENPICRFKPPLSRSPSESSHTVLLNCSKVRPLEQFSPVQDHHGLLVGEEDRLASRKAWQLQRLPALGGVCMRQLVAKRNI